ncbi:DUF6292 family protein [Amycolatopsis sp. NBC_01488]|uniref:DUF6292 family protein n=1 Tax=Amycolatopsis sp. NBC_01488 TaxID=2903563 RepID=UPI002E281B6B|nr:DUF6292 family protein [Amycolatopsis sp. NBC_01488]
MTTPLHLGRGNHPALTTLHDYLAEVTAALGIGMESCTVDHDTPVSAYIALDQRLPGYPDRDVALLWDEVHGWSAAIETHSAEDMIVVRYLGGTTVTPVPARVTRFLTAVQEDDHRIGRLDPPALRTAGGLDDLHAVLRSRRTA